MDDIKQPRTSWILNYIFERPSFYSKTIYKGPNNTTILIPFWISGNKIKSVTISRIGIWCFSIERGRLSLVFTLQNTPSKRIIASYQRPKSLKKWDIRLKQNALPSVLHGRQGRIFSLQPWSRQTSNWT